jgi:hypothetical protein
MAEGKPSKADDVARLRQHRYDTKGPGAHRAPPAKPSVDVLRKAVAKVAKKKSRKRGRR